MRPRHLLLFAAAFALSAQEKPPQVQTQVYVTAIDVVVDVRDKAGNLPQGLKPADFVVVEDGVERTVVGAQYLRHSAAAATPVAGAAAAPAPAAASESRPEWQLVLYFETELSSGTTRNVVAKELSKQADVLASLGKVDVVLADPTPKALVRGSRDAEAIRQALGKVMAVNGPNRLAIHRRHFVDETQGPNSLSALKAQVKSDDPYKSPDSHKPPMNLQPKGTPPGVTTGSSAAAVDFDMSGATPTRVTVSTIRPWVQQEMQLISHFRQNLAGWLASYRRQTQRTLLLVTDGFDVDPLDFYRNFLHNRSVDASFEDVARMNDSVGVTAKSLASAGWMTISIPGDSNGDAGWLDDASTSSTGRVHQARSAVNKYQILMEPREPLETIAAATGGSVVPNSGKIGAAIASIDDRLLVTFQVDRKPDGKPRKLEIRARDANLKVRSVQWASSATPDQLAETRAINLLAVDPGISDFPLEASVTWNPPAATRSGLMRVVGRLDSVRAILPANGRGDFRVTMAVQVPPAKTFAVNSVLANYDLNQPTFHFQAPVTVPADATAIALVIEELSSGVSGVARVDIR